MANERRKWPNVVVAFLVERQDGFCGRGWNSGGCGSRLVLPLDEDGDEFEGIDLDHIQPLADGGLDTVRNLQLLHAGCHRAKTGNEAGDRAGV